MIVREPSDGADVDGPPRNATAILETMNRVIVWTNKVQDAVAAKNKPAMVVVGMQEYELSNSGQSLEGKRHERSTMTLSGAAYFWRRKRRHATLVVLYNDLYRYIEHMKVQSFDGDCKKPPTIQRSYRSFLSNRIVFSGRIVNVSAVLASVSRVGLWVYRQHDSQL